MDHVVIMAGGGGTRLWPASRRARPKQLLALGPSGETMLGMTRRRLAQVVPAERTLVITSWALREAVRAALPDLAPSCVVGEPVGRNTAAALGLAAQLVSAHDPDAVLACLPADQFIADEAGFAATVKRALELATTSDVIVTIGLRPTRAETGFGYLELGAQTSPGVFAVQRFVEKPDAATAARYLAAGNYLWNGGMFFLRARRLLAEIRRHLPELAAGLDKIGAGAPLAEVYPQLPSISIDHGVMEKAEGIVTLPGDFGWNDVGAWSALPDVLPADANANVVAGGATLFAEDAHGNVVHGDDGTLVALVGVKDLVVVKAGHRILVMPRGRAQDVKAITDALAKAGRQEDL